MDQAAALLRLRVFVVRRRHELRLTQAGLAAVSGLSKPTLSRLEQGTLASLPKLGSLAKLARGLRVRMEELQDLVSKGGSTPERARPRVLIAAGDESLRRLLTQGLDRSGYASVSANDGEMALSVINYAEPAVLVLDTALTGICARDLLQYLRRDQGFKGQIIALTGDNAADVELKDLEPGQLLHKGQDFSVTSLANVVDRMLSGGGT